MATYKKDKDHVVEYEEARAVINNLPNPRDKFLVAILYITGARPVELAYRFKRKDIEIDPTDTHIQLTLYTAKLQKVKTFSIPSRTLQVPKTAPFVENVIIPYSQAYDNDPERPMFKCSPTRIRQIVYAGSNNTLFPYNFRHSRLYRLGSKPGTTETDLKNWKGGGSIKAYISGKPIRKDLVID